MRCEMIPSVRKSPVRVLCVVTLLLVLSVVSIWAVSAESMALQPVDVTRLTQETPEGNWECGSVRLPPPDSEVAGMQLPESVFESLALAPTQPPAMRPFYAYSWIEDSYYVVTATLQVTGTRSYIYVDENEVVPQTVLDFWRDEFDNTIFPSITGAFGEPPNIDGDDRIYLLLLDIQDGNIAGYFDSRNQMSRIPIVNPFSNEMEILYIDTMIGDEEVIAHEFTHMVHYAADDDEELWVHEGIADYGIFETYGTTNPGGHVTAFANQPDTTLTETDGNAYGVPNYGADFLFMLYISEKYNGTPTIRDILQDTANGIPSINNHLPTDFEDVFKTWVIANYLDNPNVDVLYGYTNLDVHVTPIKDETYDGTRKTIDGWFGISDETMVNPWAADYIKFSSTTEEDMELLFNGSMLGSFEVKLLFYEGGDVTVVDLPSSNNLTIPTPNEYDEIIVIVAGTGSSYIGNNYWILLAPAPVYADAVLDFDRSGSMSGQKISDAKEAAKTFVDLLEEPSSWWIFKTDKDKVGLVSFSTQASVDLHLTSDFDQAKRTIDGYSAGGNTNMGDALTKSIQEFKSNAREGMIHSIIYLTDGQITAGMSREEVRDSLVPQAVAEGISIYTFGYGTDVDEPFLKEIASRANGKYYFAPDADTLRRVYIELSHAIKGWSKTQEFSGYLAAGETKTVGALDISPGLPLVKIILAWPGSDLDLILLDPESNPVDPGTTGVIYSGNDVLPEYYELYEPQPGIWTIQVHGKDIPGATEEYDVFVFQPGALMQVTPTSWDFTYPDERERVFTVSELSGMADLTGVTFTASPLTEVLPISQVYQQMAEAAAREARGEPSLLVSSGAMTGNEIPASAFSFTPNNFSVPAGGSVPVVATLTVPDGTPPGIYEGQILVTGGTQTTTIGVRVTVTPSGPLPPCPTVIVPWPGATVVTGQWVEACAGFTVQALDEDGNVLGSGTVQADGSFSISLSRSVESGERLRVVGSCLGSDCDVPFPYPVPIPEPATLLLLGSGLAGLAGYARLRSRKRRQ